MYGTSCADLSHHMISAKELNIQTGHYIYKKGAMYKRSTDLLLPMGRGKVRYILVRFEVFSKYVKLFPLKTVTTNSCLNKLVNHYYH
jgi:hypothetical protein